MSSFWQELKRRNVIRIALLYSVSGWVMLQIADVLFGLMEIPAWGLRLVLGLLLLGFPVALIFSWVFEMTPEGIKREKDIDRSHSVSPATGRKIDRLIIAGLILVVLVLLSERFLFPPTDMSPTSVGTTSQAEAEQKPSRIEQSTDTDLDEQRKSIAVLPFVNMSGDENNEYFSDGLTEELLNLLARVDGLRVSSRTSSFAFKGKDTNIPSVARELKVEHILEGSVRKSGETIRITAQLIDVDSDSHLWSETYDRQLTDIFAVQDEIANAVVESLKLQLLEGGDARLTSNLVPVSDMDTDAYLLYLRGRHIYEVAKNGDDIAMIRQAESMFLRALEIDPDYALAYAGLADVYGRLSIAGELSNEEGYNRSREMAIKALEIDPDLVEALLALADVLLEYDWDLNAAEAKYLRALKIRPSDAEGLRTYGYFLASDGRFDEAIEYYMRALEVDPLQLRAHTGLAFLYIITGYFEGLEQISAVLRQQRGDEFVNRWRGFIDLSVLRRQGQYAEVLQRMDEQPQRVGDLVDAAISAWHVGDREKAQSYLQQLIEANDETQDDFAQVAAVYTQMGEYDLAFDYLNQAVDNREVNLPFIRVDPDLDPLKDDPRFDDLLRRAGIRPLLPSASPPVPPN